MWAASDEVSLPDSFLPLDGSGSPFELTFFCDEEDGGTRLFARHGGPFRSWFTTSTQEDEFLYSDSDELGRHSRRWTFAMYVNTKVPDVEELRRELLSYTGGQSLVRCREHELPLIVVGTRTFSDSERCPGLPDGNGCGKKLYYKCPKEAVPLVSVGIVCKAFPSLRP